MDKRDVATRLLALTLLHRQNPNLSNDLGIELKKT